MKKRICLILSLILLLPGILLAYGSSLPSYYSDTYYAQLSAQYEKLANTTGRKIIILGGSNVAFGVDSRTLETALEDYGYDYTVCNFGLYAAVGTSAMLSLSEDFLGEGDIVVLAIEPGSQTFSTYFGATAMLKCAEDNPEMLLHLNKQQKSNVVGNYVEYLQERAVIAKSQVFPKGEGAYTRASFNENGDMIYDRPGNLMPLGYDTAMPIDLTAVTFEDAFVRQVNDYIRQARRKGAEVVMSFSPMNRGALTDASEETVYGYFTALQKAFPCTMISDPNRYIMDSGWFYDSNFHLNTAGMAVRTHQLGCDLLNFLGYYGAVPFEMPQMPAPVVPPTEEGTDSGDFIFTAVGESGLLVSGLTEQGRKKEQLILPSGKDGKIVVGITADAFAGITTLRELTFPATIESIPDGAFSGCVNLKRLTLLHRDNPPRVEAGLLDGAQNLTIFVPSDAYHLYRDGAGCTVNPWEQFLNRIVAY